MHFFFFFCSLADIQLWDVENLKGLNQFIMINKTSFFKVWIAMKYPFEEDYHTMYVIVLLCPIYYEIGWVTLQKIDPYPFT